MEGKGKDVGSEAFGTMIILASCTPWTDPRAKLILYNKMILYRAVGLWNPSWELHWDYGIPNFDGVFPWRLG